MGTAFWIRRFLLVFAGSFVVIAATQLLKGHEVGFATSQALGWAAVAAAIFTISRIYQSRRGQHCAVCKDTPER